MPQTIIKRQQRERARLVPACSSSGMKVPVAPRAGSEPWEHSLTGAPTALM
jgi:hypothetical protein